MHAVIEDGSRQYRVQAGDLLRVDYREDAQPGSSLSFERVLAAHTDSTSRIGRPLIEGASVTAEVIGTTQDPKLEIGKFKRRKGYIRHNGHIQMHTTVKVVSISVPGLSE